MTRRPIATMTRIHGTGQCQAIVNGVVMEEMARMNERHKYEMNVISGELEAAKTHRNKLLAKDLEDLRVQLARPTSFWARLREKMEITWCVFIGTIMELGSVTYVRSSEEDI